MPLITVAALSEPGKPHAWQVGSVETLCGEPAEGMCRAGAWPPVAGDVCRTCEREHRLRMSRSLWASVEDWLAPGREAVSSSRRAGQGAEMPHGVGPGLRHLWDFPAT